jgi:adenylyltransferase/sulfurtransferase
VASEGESRYARHILLPEIGEEGQRRLEASSALVVGCGGLGSTLSQILVRAGIGALEVIDGDAVEVSNLHRQILYDEDDAAGGRHKAEVAAEKLARMNSNVRVRGRRIRLEAGNAESLVADVDIVLDGADNVETRYVLNDACVKLGKRWIYAGVIGMFGMVMPVMPGSGPCLRCAFPQQPPPGALPTSTEVGVFGPAPILIASLQATEAIKLLLGDESGVGRLTTFDVWHRGFARIEIARRDDCPACGERRFDFLG